MSAQIPESPASKVALRTGKCGALVLNGTCRCEMFELDRVQDGYRTCTCHHTQWVHSKQG